MNNTKRIFALLLAGTLTAPAFACDKDNKSSSDGSVSLSERDSSQVETIKSVKERFTDYLIADESNSYSTAEEIVLKNKTVKWLSPWDINPDQDGDTLPTDLQLFQEVYGGTIEYIPTSFETRFDSLATAIIGGEGVDFFSACDADTFPRFALKDQFVPIDDYIDVNSELWEGTAEMAENFVLNDKHYVAVCDVSPAAMCIYNKSTIDAYGLTDPAKLYREGNWNWNTFKELLTTFTSQGEGLYGMDSWYYEEAIMLTCGTSLVAIEDGEVVSNLFNTDLERVQNFMYELYTLNLSLPRADFGWKVHPEMLGTGNLLFYISYNWDINKDTIPNYGGSENVMLVPMPKDPDSDEYYLHASMDAYSFVSGGQNPEGVAAYLNSKRYAIQSPEFLEINLQDQKDAGWTDEMIEMYNEIKELTLENPVYEYCKGCTNDLSSLADSSLRLTLLGTQWAQTRDEISVAFQAEIDATNALAVN